MRSSAPARAAGETGRRLRIALHECMRRCGALLPSLRDAWLPAHSPARGHWGQLVPWPSVHADLPALTAFAMADQDRASVRSRSLSFRASASLMRSPARQSTTIRPGSAGPCCAAVVPGESSTGLRASGADRRCPAASWMACVLRQTMVDSSIVSPPEPARYVGVAWPRECFSFAPSARSPVTVAHHRGAYATLHDALLAQSAARAS
jgi:hypothetical protein